MVATTKPTVVVDRSTAPQPSAPPAPPTGLYPVDGSFADPSYPYVKLMVATTPRALRYEIAVEHWNGTAWRPYTTWSRVVPFLRFVPTLANHVYRFRARAQNAKGWGGWSSWSSFDYGAITGARPGGP